MSAILLALLVDRMFFQSSSSTAGTGSGVAATQARSVPSFTGVDLAGANDVIVEVGARQSVVVHADSNLLGRVTTRVRSGTLVIGTTRETSVPRARCSWRWACPPSTASGFRAPETSPCGDGTIMLTATNRLSARISGTGAILYGGNPPHVLQRVTGSGTISPG